MEISYVIPTLNSASTLDMTILSLKHQEGVKVNILVVDSGSTDGTLDICKRWGVESLYTEPGNMYKAINTVINSGLSGFFYTIVFNSTKLTHKFNLFSSIIFMAIITKILYFCYRIIVASRSGQSILWSGNPLNANMFDYIQYLYAGLN